ncbi:hypothetical protein [Actinomadura parmotrematis]|uniref:Uncharacterized protein n=1 Tax=Actinomadura parmotrematis TaxID=2864039 RepID=A0ABS7FWJ1_9ACTN|nr:hypothetical protein [Actinomadura parmotrematis]MBW8484792.1 hypothetical protein [Actinomadura parmotrematis]
MPEPCPQGCPCAAAPPRTALGRFLHWLAPDGEHDDWLQPDPDPEGEEDGPAVGTVSA